MQASVTLWEKWQEQVKQLWPSLHGHQQKGLALLVIGIVLSGSAVLQRVAESLFLEGISQAKMTSIERRLARFVANRRIVVTKVWKQFLSQVLPYWQGQKLRFVLDCTPFDDREIIVYVGLLVHSRVLPVAWSVMPAQEKWDQGQWEIVGRLLDSFIPYLGNADCTDASPIEVWPVSPWCSCVASASGIICCVCARNIPFVVGSMADGRSGCP